MGECGRAEQSGGRSANAAHNRPLSARSRASRVRPADGASTRPPSAGMLPGALVFGILMLPSTTGDAPGRVSDMSTGAKLAAPIASWFMRSVSPAGVCSVPPDAKVMAQGTTFGHCELPPPQEGPQCHPDDLNVRFYLFEQI